MSQPLTLRYNNPGAVEFKPWMGAYGATLGPNGRYAQFETPDQGYSVMGRILDTYQNKHGLNTVSGIVNRWAPADVDNNSTGSYINSVSRRLGIDPNAPLAPEHRTPLIQAMAAYEAGRAPAPMGGAAPPASSTPPASPGAAPMNPMGAAPSANGWTPESVGSSRQLGARLLNAGMDTGPAQHWTQALARVLQAGSGAAWTQQANEGERAGNQAVADIYKRGMETGMPMNQMAGALMGTPFGMQRGQQLADSYLNTSMNQGFQREQQNRQFGHAERMQNAQFGQQRSMAELNDRLEIEGAGKKAAERFAIGQRYGLQGKELDAYAISGQAPGANSNTAQQPTWGLDEQNKPVIMQLDRSGRAVRTAMPPGVRPVPPGDLAFDKAQGQELGEAFGKSVANLGKAEGAFKAYETQQNIVTQDIDRVLKGTNWATTGWVGNVGTYIPGSPAYNLARTLDTIKANIGFDKLAEMRANSPTGGALGAVTEFENKLLQSVLGSLEQAQSPEQLRYNLQRLKDTIGTMRTQRREALESDQRKFGEAARRPPPVLQGPRADAPAQAAPSAGAAPAASTSGSGSPRPRAVNPQTGQAVEWNGSEWVPAQ